jgi:hypothetical protein
VSRHRLLQRVSDHRPARNLAREEPIVLASHLCGRREWSIAQLDEKPPDRLRQLDRR